MGFHDPHFANALVPAFTLCNKPMQWNCVFCMTRPPGWITSHGATRGEDITSSQQAGALCLLIKRPQ